MINVAEAHERLARNIRVLTGAESVELRKCLGRILASDIISDIDVPPADNSAMDGYALFSEDWQGPDHAIEVSQRITAGRPPEPLKKGTAARIFTGAETPAGADIVVMQEKSKTDGQSVWLEAIREPGGNIRPKAEPKSFPLLKW